MREQYEINNEFENNLQETNYELLPEFEISAPPNNGSRTTNDYVKWVQTKLNQSLGLRLTVDGKMGPNTRSAIRSFQRKSGLTADGIIGPKTEQALKNVVESFASNSNTQPGTERLVRGQVHQRIQIAAKRIESPEARQAEVAPPVPVVGPAIAAASLGYTILKDIFSNQGDITWSLQKLDGIKSPFDDARYQNAGTWTFRKFPVKQRLLNIFGSEKISAQFEVRYWTNGYAIGNISIINTNTNDAIGWALNVSAEIMPDAASYIIDGVKPIAAVSVTFIYRFSNPFFNDDIYQLDLKLYGNGRMDQSGRWTQ